MQPITVGITCYREGEWLRECWESVLAQDEDRWEAVLVMDGGADEATRKVFGELQHPRLRKFAFGQNMGPYPVRNKAFELTRTPYHFYLDGDDLLPPDAVGLALRGFEQCPSAATVIGDVECFGDYHGVDRYPRVLTWDTFVERLGSHGFAGAGAYRKSVWQELGGYAEEMSGGPADSDFHTGVIEAGHRIFHVGRIMYRCRVRDGSVFYSRAWQRRSWEYHELMASRHPRIFADKGRLRRMLGRGYRGSVGALLVAGELAEAKALARKALARGCAGGIFTSMGVLARVPVPVFIVFGALWRLRRLGGLTCRLIGRLRHRAGNDEELSRGMGPTASDLPPSGG